MNKQNLNEKQAKALKFMQEGCNIFLSGTAGTAKTFVIQKFLESIGKRVVCLAPTGVSAANMCYQASTIHRYFELPIDAHDWDCDISSSLLEKLELTDVIIIDEISMISSKLFTKITHLIELASLYRHIEKPQLILVGDFAQLAPVVIDQEERQDMERNYGGIYAFQSTNWKCFFFRPIYLTEVVRQTGDKRFIAILNQMRDGDLSSIVSFTDSDNGLIPDTVINSLNRHAKVCSDPPEGAVVICNTNRVAKEINEKKENDLSGKQYTFKAIVKGKWSDNDFPTDYNLKLKKGSRVMNIRNVVNSDNELILVNGDIGTVVKIRLKSAIVKFDKHNEPL